MRKSLKTIPALLLAGIFLCVSCLPAQAQSLESAPPIQLTAPSYLLADAETGAIIFEKDADTPRQVASLTKLMTVLLVLERLDRGEISLDDTVTVSKTAASAPGSTALLDAGASYRVEDLLRSAIVASGNDSAAALAEQGWAVHKKEEGQIRDILAGKGFPRPFVDATLEQLGVEYVD